MAVEAVYTWQLVVMATPEVGAEIETEADERKISKATVVRELIDLGRAARKASHAELA